MQSFWAFLEGVALPKADGIRHRRRNRGGGTDNTLGADLGVDPWTPFHRSLEPTALVTIDCASMIPPLHTTILRTLTAPSYAHCVMSRPIPPDHL